MLFITRIRLRLLRRRAYWMWRYALHWFRFWFAARRFKISHGFEESGAALSIFWVLTRESLLPLLSAVVGALAVTFVFDARWPIPVRAAVDQDAYNALMGTIAGVTGIFLALYFAAVSTVAGAIYNRVPNDVRELLVREKVGGFYVSLLAFITAFTLLLLGLRGFGFQPSKWGMIVALILVTPGVFSFAKLGQRAFYFFDPTALADALFRDMKAAANLASRRGYRWGDPSFQEHYRKQANRAARTLETLVAFARGQEILRGPLTTLAMKTIWYAGAYLRTKKQIPSDSRWFEQVPKYTEWYLADSSSLDLATITMTGLTPKMIPDAYWLENHLLDRVDEALQATLVSSDPSAAVNVLGAYSELATRLGEEWEVDFARQRGRKLSELILHRLGTAKPGGTQEEFFRVSLALIEGAAMLPLSAALGVYKSLDSLDLSAIRKKILTVAWNSPGAIYDLGLPASLREQFEYVSRRLPFEIAAEGKAVSPDWYLTQLIYLRLATVLSDNLDSLIKWVSSFFPPLATRLRGGSYAAHAATICTRGLEACAKLERHLSRYKVCAETFDQAHILQDLRKTGWPFEAWYKTIEETEAALHGEFAQLIPSLAQLKLTADLPDLFGEAVHRVGEACFHSLQENRPSHFEKLFPAYFIGIFGIIEKIREKTPEFDPEALAPFLVEPLMDLMALSGYAFAWAQLHDDRRLWHSCLRVWDSFLRLPLARQRLEYLGAAIRYRWGLFGLTPRDMLRTRWGQIVDAFIRELPRQDDSGLGELGFSTRPRHPNPLIQIMGRDELGSMYDGVDIFVAIYLRRHPQSRGIDFGRDDLSESLDRIRTRPEAENRA